MQVNTSFRHMDASPALKVYAEEKIERVIRKYIRDNFDAQVTLSVEKFRHQVDILLSYKGLSIKCDGTSEDMYASLDLALDKLERQVRRYKDKLRRHKPSEGRDRLFELSVIRSPQEEAELSTEEFDIEVLGADLAEEYDAAAAPEAASVQQPVAATAATDGAAASEVVAEASPSHAAPTHKHHQVEQVHVLKREVMTAHPMSVDDAIMQLDLEQRAFLVFTNRETNSINVIYRRGDGNFGLIEPRT